MSVPAVIDRHLRPLVGKPCWGVRVGYANNLVLEFGRPRLEVQST